MVIKSVVIAILLAMFVSFLALITFGYYRIEPLGVALIVSFFCFVIVTSAGIIINKLNLLNRKIDLLLKEANVSLEDNENKL